MGLLKYNQKSNHKNLRAKHLLKLNKCRTKTNGLNVTVFKSAIFQITLRKQVFTRIQTVNS